MPLRDNILDCGSTWVYKRSTRPGLLVKQGLALNVRKVCETTFLCQLKILEKHICPKVITTYITAVLRSVIFSLMSKIMLSSWDI